MKRILLALLISTSLLSPLAKATDTNTSTEFDLTVLDETQTLTLEDIGVEVNRKNNMSYFRRSLFSHISFFSYLKKQNPYDFEWNAKISEGKIRELFDLSKARNARFVMQENLTIQAEKNGYIFDTEELIKEIIADYPNLEKEYELEVSEPDLITAEELIEHYSQVSTLTGEGLKMSTNEKDYYFPAQLKDIVIKQESDAVSIQLNTPYLLYVISTLKSLVNKEAQNMTILDANPYAVSHTTSQGHVVDGMILSEELTKEVINSNISSGNTSSVAVLSESKGQIINNTSHDLGPLTHIATGVSNFYTSPNGRDHNVRKALNEHFNNILIPPGAEFSFNSFLGPVTYSAGWQGSLAIFGGTQLRTVPGGGICQVSTTMYRAALDAGLEIKKQRNHSLYVHYYEAYGDGLDATVFPGSQDLVFVNNTGNYILIEAYDDGYDAYIKFYGNDDGRSTNLFGPYTKSNQTEELISELGGLTTQQIAWKYIINWPNRQSEEKWLVSSYRSSVKQY